MPRTSCAPSGLERYEALNSLGDLVDGIRQLGLACEVDTPERRGAVDVVGLDQKHGLALRPAVARGDVESVDGERGLLAGVQIDLDHGPLLVSLCVHQSAAPVAGPVDQPGVGAFARRRERRDRVAAALRVDEVQRRGRRVETGLTGLRLLAAVAAGNRAPRGEHPSGPDLRPGHGAEQCLCAASGGRGCRRRRRRGGVARGVALRDRGGGRRARGQCRHGHRGNCQPSQRRRRNTLSDHVHAHTLPASRQERPSIVRIQGLFCLLAVTGCGVRRACSRAATDPTAPSSRRSATAGAVHRRCCGPRRRRRAPRSRRTTRRCRG